MIASDNSAQGVEDVCTGIIQQTDLDETEFYSRLLMLDGDLGTCVNVKCLQNQRFPSSHIENSLDNFCPLLGGAHTLWNIGQAIYTKHFGNNSDSRDSGAWRYLESLGIPSSKTLDKKDFTLMIANMIKIHEATIVHCVMLEMGKKNASLDPEPQELPSKEIAAIIKSTHARFFSAKARADASKRESPKLLNLQLRLLDFASVCEANAAMKLGDIGRVMFMWKRWAVMAQGIKKLSNYAVHLPRMVVLINEILPPGLSKVVRHALLVAPSNRQKHFVAKDLYLELQNYSLKYFFNHSGKGTDIKRLRDVYSVNVPLLQSLIQGLNKQSGSENVIQSHHNKIKLQSLNNCLRMVRQNDVCNISSKNSQYIPEETPYFYKKGMAKLSSDSDSGRINRLRPPPISNWDVDEFATGCQYNNINSDTSESDGSSKEDSEEDSSKDESEENESTPSALD
ncbi:uncharacterized protein PGTG_11091 [Puccinia graminis f. sp. tritici CRL 75-36-700-3]|uniref:DUF6589 domain-containing protein n=1 Tax=Puccinia graminis f. sp. tritici (strain CRL 75-36-700-3 / race SCCL) TaxID=418459 RepID=E3KNC6_PUCGT|nr:uncharacterized protein PGTG_11091 [Puccinia graminis f. sp. tritici CRL 75-36-700-3]EFP85762.2 hypothetical protein PGTG_11091 [Puccinia graminis f. sp. tritici CRL 75-36-700-3]